MIYTESMKIRPSILAANLSEIDKEIASILSLSIQSIHFDIWDGLFVPSLMLQISLLDKISKKTCVDIHLMVRYPSKYFSQILEYRQVTAVAFHIESLEDIRENISYLRWKGRRVGLSILPSTPTDHLDQYLLEIDYVLIMTVKGGYSGTPFIPEVLQKIKEIHGKRPELTIVVDWWINLETAELCTNQWASEAVVGSALFSQKNRKKYLELLSKIVRK